MAPNKMNGQILLEAARRVKKEGLSMRQVSLQHGIKYQTLYRYMRKLNNNNNNGINKRCPTPSIHASQKAGSYHNKRILSMEVETRLMEYLRRASDVFFGLTTIQIRKMVYRLACNKNLKVPQSWHINKMPGVSWYANFLSRYPALRANLARIHVGRKRFISLQDKVDVFFCKLKDLQTRCSFRSSNIYNMHEYAVSTLDVAEKFVVRGNNQSKRQHGLVTLTTTISADGRVMPPVFLFPNEEKIKPADPHDESKLVKISQWIDDCRFFGYLQHFVRHSHCSKTNPCLLIVDNQSYLSIKAMDYADEHGVVLLSFPQFCSPCLQPLLDRFLCDNFAQKIMDACIRWKVKNPGKNMREQDVTQMILENYKNIFNESSIKNAFKNRGIYPLKRMTTIDECEEVNFGCEEDTGLKKGPDEDMEQVKADDEEETKDEKTMIENYYNFYRSFGNIASHKNMVNESLIYDQNKVTSSFAI